MRTIKFRGKHIKTGEWLYGSHYNDGAEDYILENLPNSALDFEERQIDQNTLGQFMGLQDSKGNDIYKGDILRNNDTNEIYEILWDEDYLTFAYRKIGSSQNYALYTIARLLKHSTIIGNIHDNTELLKGGEK